MIKKQPRPFYYNGVLVYIFCSRVFEIFFNNVKNNFRVEVNIIEYVTGPDEKGLYDIFGNTTVTEDDAKGADVRCELVYLNPKIAHQQFIDTEVYSGK